MGTPLRLAAPRSKILSINLTTRIIKSRESSIDKIADSFRSGKKLNSKWTSKSLVNSARIQNRDTSSNSKQLNEYGFRNMKTNRDYMKSFNSPHYHINSLKGESTLLNKDEIQRYLKLLGSYVSNGQDSKVITTLKMLLSHFTRKNAVSPDWKNNTSRSKNSASVLSPKSNTISSKNKPKKHEVAMPDLDSANSVSGNLRKTLDFYDRSSHVGRVTSARSNKTAARTAKTTHKVPPREVEFNLEELKMAECKVKKFELFLGDKDINKNQPSSSEK